MSAASQAGSRADATIWLALLADGSEPCTSGAGQLGSRVATAAFLGDSSRESRCASPSEVQPAVSAIARAEEQQPRPRAGHVDSVAQRS